MSPRPRLFLCTTSTRRRQRRVPGGRRLPPAPADASTAAVDGWATPLRLAEETPPRLSLDDAVRVQDGSDAPFLFFLDDANGRGHVLYRRYDGHYGLITPADG